MKHVLISLFFLLTCVAGSFAGEGCSGGACGDGYTGGLGLITAEGPSGMFLNPTSGVHPKGAIVPNFCVSVANPEGTDDHAVAEGFNVVYGVLDNWEVGFQGLLVQPNTEDDLDAFGAQTRYRIVKDHDWIPEWSVGAYFLQGDDPLTKQDVFTALSKAFILHDGCYFNLVRFHLGGRFEWHEVLDDRPVGYVGAEVRVMPMVYLVSEVSTKDDDVEENTPYSFGIQVRSHKGFGFSLAGVQDGNTDGLGIFIGVGISFQL
jgi:hypothetical protein